MLHLWLGHLDQPDNLKARVREHLEQMVELRDGVAAQRYDDAMKPQGPGLPVLLGPCRWKRTDD